jgi:hypothetical protein
MRASGYPLAMTLMVAVAMAAPACRRVDHWHLSGSVTYDGKPVSDGLVTMSPLDARKGGGFAKIVNGIYDTRSSGRPHTGGPHRVTITAYRGLKNSDNLDSDVLLLFPPYSVESELPNRADRMNFDVPAQAK